MHNNIFACRVCGYLMVDSPPWGEDGITPSFDICDCCGVEFGYEDGTIVGIKRYREEWLQNGTKWFRTECKPGDWIIENQMANIPEEFR